MGFYRDIATNYGSDSLHLLKQWANTNTRLANFRNRRIFLLNCRSNGVLPKHITKGSKCMYNLLDNSTCAAKEIDKINKRLRSSILTLEIKYTEIRLTKLDRELKEITNRARETLPHNIFNDFSFHQNRTYNKQFNNVKRANLGKFNKLKEEHLEEIVSKQSWVVNLTNKQIPDHVMKMFSLGPKFALPPSNKQISHKRLLAETEYAIKDLTTNSKNIIRAQATNIITNFQAKNSFQPSLANKLFQEARTYLKEHTDVMVVQSDKGNVSVIIEKTDYIQKCNTLVEDEEVYRVLNRDPTNTIEKKNNALIKSLKDNNYIDATTKKQLMAYDTVPPRLYGLPKVHKDGIPMRPIVSTVQSPTSKLSKYIADILKISFANYNEFAVINSKMFAEKVNDLVLPENYVLVSLDVVSLFTNISLELTCYIVDENWEIIADNTEIPKDVFIQIIEFLFESNYFLYNRKYYQQKFGCPMGSCLSPILANIVMSTLLKTSIPRLSYNLPFIFQYEDDLILSIPEGGDEEILKIFNSFDDHLKFTIETETDRSVPFLDTKVKRDENNTIKLDWYRKPTSSGRYINNSSYHDISMKTNIILGLKKKILDIAHPTNQKSAINRLFKLMKDNGYSSLFLEKLLYSTPRPPEESMESNDDNLQQEDRISFAKFPHIKEMTAEITKLLRRAKNIKIGKYNLVTSKALYSKQKDKIPINKTKDTIYQLNCKHCEQVYVGQTSQALSKRIALHKSDITLRPERCALAQHVRSTGHRMDFENPKILDKESNYLKRTFLEMCYINEKPSMNHKTDTNNLSAIYSYLLTFDNKISNINSS